ncbi:MAG: hypothetical protein MUD06_03255 [Rhodospirillales bacterium]|jgi:hypothetical protein|nr:hypothetical protein [Rhodospirillales bacterium]
MGQQEELTRALASALRRTAPSPFCRAMDNWLAAEEMVSQVIGAAEAGPLPEAEAGWARGGSLPSSAFPVEQVRALAQCFWEHSSRSAAITLDVWLAAERHVLAFCRAMLAGHGASQPFSAEAHWQRIHDHAEWLWQSRGRPKERDLDTWLEAEAAVLQTLATRAAGRAPAAERAVHTQRRPLALSVLEADSDAGGPCYPPVRLGHRGAQLPA